jgi:glutaryl-CoA dehydrogenase
MESVLSCRYHIGRHVANLQVANTYEGTHDIHGELQQVAMKSELTPQP